LTASRVGDGNVPRLVVVLCLSSLDGAVPTSPTVVVLLWRLLLEATLWCEIGAGSLMVRELEYGAARGEGAACARAGTAHDENTARATAGKMRWKGSFPRASFWALMLNNWEFTITAGRTSAYGCWSLLPPRRLHCSQARQPSDSHIGYVGCQKLTPLLNSPCIVYCCFRCDQRPGLASGGKQAVMS
jgi:hypothetical protein